MPLLVPEPPRQVVETVQSTFRTMRETGNIRLPVLRTAPGPLSLAQPHQIFSLGLTDLAWIPIEDIAANFSAVKALILAVDLRISWDCSCYTSARMVRASPSI